MTGAAHPGFSVKFVGVDELDRSVSEMQKPRTLSINANLFRSVFVLLPQTRHPERSASQIDRMTQRFWRGVEGPLRCLRCPCCSKLFDTEADNRICCDTLFIVTDTSFKLLVSATGTNRSGSRPARGSMVESSDQYRQNKHRRGPSTPRQKRCVMRSICEALRSG
jgi:hypothetical protein